MKNALTTLAPNTCRFIIVSSSDPTMKYYYISTQKLQIQHNCITWPIYHYFSTQKMCHLHRWRENPTLLHPKFWTK